MKFNIKSILNLLNSDFTFTRNKNIIYIKNYNNIFFSIYKYIIIRFDKKQF